MIGQRELLKRINSQIEKDKFPRVSIIIGGKGSGRKTLANYISARLEHGLTYVAPTSNAAKHILELAYQVSPALPMLYVLSDCDEISYETSDLLISALNDLPYETYFILTCENLNNIPVEVRRNAVTYVMESYSEEDKLDWFYDNEIVLEENQEDFILNVASNIGDMNQLCMLDIDDFREHIDFIFAYVTHDAENPHEITSKIASDIGDDKFPLRLVMKAFIAVCADKADSADSVVYCTLIAVTGDMLQKLSERGSNEESVLEEWLSSVKFQWENIKG